MKHQIGNLTICGLCCVGCLSCSSATAGGNAGRLGSEWGQIDKGVPEPQQDSETTPATATERRFAALVERTLARTAIAGTGLKRTARPQNRSDSSDVRSPRNRNGSQRDRRPSPSDRVETLRVTNAYGDFCAAITIAPKLAVTALHCVHTLCESGRVEASSSLVGCQINYEVPNGLSGDATVVSTSENDLLALLALQRPLSKHGALRCDDPRAEDRVYTVSHPNGENWLLSYGRLTRDPIPLEWVEGEATRVLVAEIPTQYGSSGGGLFDVGDQVVGVQIARWSPWSTDYGKAAFIQATRIFSMAGRYCMKRGSAACVGLRCASGYYDIWSFDEK